MNLLKMTTYTYDTTFFKETTEKSKFDEMIWEKHQTKKISITIQTDKLFEQKTSLVTQTNFSILLREKKILKL